MSHALPGTSRNPIGGPGTTVAGTVITTPRPAPPITSVQHTIETITLVSSPTLSTQGLPPISSSDPSPSDFPPQQTQPDSGPPPTGEPPDTSFPLPSDSENSSVFSTAAPPPEGPVGAFTDAPPTDISDPQTLSQDVVVSTMIVSTDSTSGVHTLTMVTTIASFRASPTHRINHDPGPGDGGSSSAHIGVIIMAAMGGLVAGVIVLLGIFWYRRRKRRGPDYDVTGDRTTTPGSPTWGQRFGWAFGRRPHERTESNTPVSEDRFTTGSFGNSTERILTLTPFREHRSSEAIPEKPNPYAPARVQFAESSAAGSSQGDGQATPREGLPQRDRPPTYHTNSTGIATVATTLPLYSAYDPSPISERSEPPDTPTTLNTPLSPMYGREKRGRSSTRPRPTLSSIGEKF